MGLSELPPPPEKNPGNDLPELLVRPPGPQSRTWLTRAAIRQAPMGPRALAKRAEGNDPPTRPAGPIVLSRGKGANVIDVDSNRYVDLAAGFGSLLLGHSAPAVLRAIELQTERLLQALGDVYPADAKIGLLERLGSLHPSPGAQVILGQSGADAITAAVKSAVLKTERTGLLAFQNSYHGLSYGALSVTNLRESYRDPFASHLARDVTFVPYPKEESDLSSSLHRVEEALSSRTVAALVIEPILGRGGVIVPPPGFLTGLFDLAQRAGTLVIADEIWTGLGRTGRWLATEREPGLCPDLLCIGKGLGGGLPISACIGKAEIMAAWSQEREVVHTSTFAGAPLSCAAALATLDALGRGGLVRRSAEVGGRWQARLRTLLAHLPVEVRGEGMMVGIELAEPRATELQQSLLRQGFLTSTGGGKRDVLVLTPPLMISEELLEVFDDALLFSLSTMGIR